MLAFIWLIPLLPLLGFIINGLGQRSFSKSFIGILASGAVFASFILSVAVFSAVWSARQAGEEAVFTQEIFEWFAVGDLQVSLTFLVDPLSSIMLLIITGIGFLIHLYAIGYMKHDAGFGKFFAYLNLFIFFMLLLVLGSNYLVLFIGWEGVGLCSYLLIGFWYTNPRYASAAKKAFVMNRIGDLGFLLALFFIFGTFGTLEYAGIFSAAKDFPMGDITLLTITLLLFIAATGKSAQIPLFTWLPDAMAGPTPVSALIHAATMVTAGIYLIARSNILFTLSPITLQLITIIGLATALLGAIIALTQTDIKKVLAYSTVSQLGYMFVGLGVGAFTGAFFHVITHAFFKALLFLGAGSVIHAMSDEQDMRKMGALKKSLPITFSTMLIGTIAIAGIPPFSGFFSKDEILAYAYAAHPIYWVLGFLAALCTAFYMFRLIFLTFYGSFRGTASQQEHLHESPASMTIPLIILAILAMVGGFLNVPEALGGGHALANFLAPIFADSAAIKAAPTIAHSTEYLLMGVSVVGALVMAGYAYFLFVKKADIPSEERSGMAKLSYHKFYIDELYDWLLVNPLKWSSQVFYTVVERLGIDGLVNGIGRGIGGAGRTVRLLQSGYITFYLFMMVLGVILLFVYGLVSI